MIDISSTHALHPDEAKATVPVSGRGSIGLPIVNGDGNALAIVKFARVQAAVVPRPSEPTLTRVSGGSKESKSGDTDGIHCTRIWRGLWFTERTN